MKKTLEFKINPIEIGRVFTREIVDSNFIFTTYYYENDKWGDGRHHMVTNLDCTSQYLSANLCQSGNSSGIFAEDFEDSETYKVVVFDGLRARDCSEFIKKGKVLIGMKRGTVCLYKDKIEVLREDFKTYDGIVTFISRYVSLREVLENGIMTL